MGVKPEDIERAIAAGRKTWEQLQRVCPKSDQPKAVLEKDLHEKVAQYCREKGYYFVHSRMDRRSTISVGCPDFCIAMPKGKIVWMECKRKGGKPTPKQNATIAHLQKLGHYAIIVDSWTEALLALMFNE